MSKLKIVFLGTNGWYSTNVANTICTLIETDNRYIVLDAGDGIQHLDKYVTDKNKPIDIFLSHFHLDHVFGLHIQPKFRFLNNKIRIFSQTGAKKILNTLVNKPFTASFSTLKSKGFNVGVHELVLGKNVIDDYVVHAQPLVHADPCWGFRFELGLNTHHEKIISYCTDTGPCENIISLSKNADVLITECSLLPTDSLSPDWPHMTPQLGAKSAKDSNVKLLIFTHFAAHKYTSLKLREDAKLHAQNIFANVICAHDGLELSI